MGDGWHWLWFILMLIVIDAKDDYKAEVVDLKAELTVMERNQDRLERQMNERKDYAMQVENIAKIQDLKLDQCKNGSLQEY